LLEVAELALDYPDFRCRYTLTVPTGALCGLIGPSGGGKTTLLHAIAGFAHPSGGSIRFAGRELIGLPPAERPLSILFQDHNLFPHLTAEQNVGLGVSPRLRLGERERAAVADALDRVGLAGLGARRPAELSGGQRQRVALARAPVRKRPLMLLDEPFGGLDPGLRRDMVALIDALRRDEGLTVLVSIHTPEDLGDAADLVAFIAEGRVLNVAPPAEMLRPGRHAEIDRYLGAERESLGAASDRASAIRPMRTPEGEVA
jgi:thiamine transport system ATP-binding protein